MNKIILLNSISTPFLVKEILTQKLKLIVVISILGLLTSLNVFSGDEKGIEFIHNESEGILNEVSELTNIKVLSNLNIPKAVFAGIISKGGRSPNMRFLTDLYDIIYQINKQEHLELSNFGNNQNIDFVVVGDSLEVEELKEEIISAIDQPDALIYLKAIRTDLIFKRTYYLFRRWFQDWGEFIGYGYKDDQLINGIFYVNRNRGLRRVVQEMAKMLEIPFIHSNSYSGSVGDYGGNLESTPDGTIFVGDTMSFSQKEQIRKLGNKNNVVTLDTSWLAVGHVDEMFSIIPSINTCEYPDHYKGVRKNYALVAADPLYGLNLINKSNDGLFSMAYITPDLGLNPLTFYFVSSIKQAMQHFLKDPYGEVTLDNINENGINECKEDDEVSSYCDFISFNINVKKIIERNILKLVSKTPCQNLSVVRVPQIYRKDFWTQQGVSFFPGTADLLVLRDYLIVPKVNFKLFTQEIEKVLNNALGGNPLKSKVFFIDELKEYHQLKGEIHCGTNVFREINHYMDL